MFMRLIFQLKLVSFWCNLPMGVPWGYPYLRTWILAVKGGKHWSSNLARTCKMMCPNLFLVPWCQYNSTLNVYQIGQLQSFHFHSHITCLFLRCLFHLSSSSSVISLCIPLGNLLPPPKWSCNHSPPWNPPPFLYTERTFLRFFLYSGLQNEWNSESRELSYLWRETGI